MKKILKTTLALTLAAAMVCPAAALTTSAATPTDSSFITVNVDPDDTSFVENHREVIDAIAQGMMKKQKYIDISEYKQSTDIVSQLYSSALSTHPDVFIVNRYSSFSYNYYDDGDNVYINCIYVPYLDVTEAEAAQMLEEFYDAADHYLELVSDDLSACRDEFSKAVVLHDEIVLDAHYVLENSNYNLLVKKYGLCENYARVYAYLLSQVGIYSEIVTSGSMSHEWMMVRLDGKYYHADITWDDPTPDFPGLARHTFFLWSNNGINSADTNQPHSNYNTINTASDEYDKALFHSYISKMCKIDPDKNEFYAVSGESASSGFGKLVKYNYKTNTQTAVTEINDYWRPVGEENSLYIGAYSGLEYVCGRFIYNTHDKIVMYNPSADSKIVLSSLSSGSDKYYYGIRVRNGKLYGVLAESPDVTGTETYVQDIAATITFDSDGGSKVANQTVLTGESAQAPADPEKTGYIFKGWTLDGNDYNFSSPVNSNITLKAKWEKIDSAVVTGSSLTLEGEIGINFYVNLASSAENSGIYAKMTGTKGEKVVPVTAECLGQSGDLYKFTYKVAAKDVDKDVTLSLYDSENNALTLYKSDGQSVCEGNEYSYCVRDYINAVENAPLSYDDKIVELVKALEDYTTASAVLFGDETVQATSNNDLSTVTKESVEQYKPVINGSVPAGITMTGYSLVLDSETRVKLYMKTENKDGYVIKLDDEAAVLKEAGDSYYVSVDNITARELADSHTLSINGEEYNISFNALSYVYTVLSVYGSNVSKQNLCNTVRALRLYYDAADEYFRSVHN